MNQSTPKKRSKAALRRVTWILVVVVIIGVAAYKISRPVSVPAARVVSSTIIQTVVATGRISPPATVEVGVRQPGVISEVFAKEGEQVEAGALLVHLEDRELLAQREASAEVVAQARLRLANLRRVLSPKAVEELKQADLQVRQAEDDTRRIEVLRSAGAANDADLERVKLALDQARSRRESVAVQAGSVSAGGVEARLALSLLSQAEAAMQQVEERVADTHLTARVAGTVLAVRADVGDSVQPGQVLVVLAASGALEVKVPVDEKNIAGVEPGKSALVAAEAYPDRQFTAVVDKLAPSVDATRGTVEVTLKIASPPPFLRPEMTASVEIEVARRKDALSVPREAVLTGVDGDAVWLLRNGRAERRAVEFGIRGVDTAEVLSGLVKGEVVLLPVSGGLETGTRVKAEFGTTLSIGDPS